MAKEDFQYWLYRTLQVIFGVVSFILCLPLLALGLYFIKLPFAMMLVLVICALYLIQNLLLASSQTRWRREILLVFAIEWLLANVFYTMSQMFDASFWLYAAIYFAQPLLYLLMRWFCPKPDATFSDYTAPGWVIGLLKTLCTLAGVVMAATMGYAIRSSLSFSLDIIVVILGALVLLVQSVILWFNIAAVWQLELICANLVVLILAAISDETVPLFMSSDGGTLGICGIFMAVVALLQYDLNDEKYPNYRILQELHWFKKRNK